MDILVVGQQMLVLFGMILIGYILAKGQWIDERISSALSRLVVNIFNPFLTISSVFGKSISETGAVFWQNLLLVGFFYAILFLAGLAMVLILRPGKTKSSVYRLLTLLPNCGFMGIPVVTALLGKEYIIYVAIYMLVYNIILYTYGIQLVRRSSPDYAGSEKLSFIKRMKPVFCNFGVVACILALVIFFGGVDVPDSICSFCEYMGNPCIPLSMLLIGCSLAAAPLPVMFKNVRMYGFVLVKMLVIPVAAACVAHLFPFDDMIVRLFIIMLSMPAGSMVVLVTEQYKGDITTASAGVVLSTVASLVTIPAVSLFM